MNWVSHALFQILSMGILNIRWTGFIIFVLQVRKRLCLENDTARPKGHLTPALPERRARLYGDPVSPGPRAENRRPCLAVRQAQYFPMACLFLLYFHTRFACFDIFFAKLCIGTLHRLFPCFYGKKSPYFFISWMKVAFSQLPFQLPIQLLFADTCFASRLVCHWTTTKKEAALSGAGACGLFRELPN